MEELLAQQVAQLREQQAQLEQQLQVHQAGVAAPPMVTGGARQVTEIPVNRAASGTDKLPRPAALAESYTERSLSLRERLQQLDAMKRKYQRQANKAMNGYFSAVSDYPAYRAKREEQMKGTQPFHFESRELTRPQRIRERRVEEERQQQERVERAWRESHFRAAPVPPTTFMNKYDLMVEEWCERKAAAVLRAREVADTAREEAAFIRLSAQGLRHTREELMGATYDPRTGRAMTRSELRRRRAQSADAAVARGVRAVHAPEDIPLEVRMTLWPAIKDHEQVRRQRIKQSAAEKKREADTHFTATMPLLSSPTPHQLFPGLGVGAASATVAAGPTQAFGIGQPIAPPPPPPLPPPPTQVSAVPLQPPVAAGTVPGIVPIAPVTAAPVPQTQPPAPTAAGITTAGITTAGIAGPTAATVLPAVTGEPPSLPPASTPAAVPTAAAEPKKRTGDRSRSRSLTRHNPNLTFKPNVKPGVPDFKALWAEDKARLLERKKSRPPTTPKPFDITVSEKEKVVRGKRSSRAVPQPGKRRAQSAAPAPARPLPPPPLPVAESGPKEAKSSGGGGGGVPRGTKAHALRTEAVYAKYIQQATHTDEVSAEDEAFLKEAAKRRREVGKRLTEYLTDTRTEHEHTIRAKVRALRAAMRENEESAQQRLAEMRARVAQMPPLFAEPVALNEESKARAAAEQEVVSLLKQSGLDAATIRDILVKPAEEDAAPTAGVEAVTGEAGKTDGGEAVAEAGESVAAAGDGDGEAKEGQAKANTAASSRSASSRSSSTSSGSSSSSSDSSSRSGHSSSAAVARKSPAASTLSVPQPVPLAALSASTSASALPSPAAPDGSTTTPALVATPVPVPVPVPVASAGGSGEYGDDSFEASSSDDDDTDSD